MPYKDPEKTKKYRKLYYLGHIEYIKQRNRRYRLQNKDRIALLNKQYRDKHREELILYSRNYYLNNKDKFYNLNKEYAKKNSLVVRESGRIRMNEYRRKLKFKIFSYYTNGKMCCEDCGDTIFETLTIDHMNGGGVLHRKELGGNDRLYGWLVRMWYPEGFRVLCIRCNWLKGKVTTERYNEILTQINNHMNITPKRLLNPYLINHA